jgi:hypothetical protein
VRVPDPKSKSGICLEWFGREHFAIAVHYPRLELTQSKLCP